jgi:hypothetical protein
LRSAASRSPEGSIHGTTGKPVRGLPLKNLDLV